MADKQTTPVDAPDASVDRAELDSLRTQLAALTAANAARERREAAATAAAAGEPVPVVPTHLLVLSNGDTLETANPSVTHHSDEHGVYPVVSRHVLNPGDL